MTRTCILAIVAIVTSFAIDGISAVDGPPVFNIAKNCREEISGGAIGTIETCSKDETDAKNALTRRWYQFSASQKKSCIGEASIGGDQSYVELLSCLERVLVASSVHKNRHQFLVHQIVFVIEHGTA